MRVQAMFARLISTGVLPGLLLGAALSVSCSEESPKLVPLPLEKKERIKNTGDNKVSFNRAVDVLFVIDDSASMSTHQKNLAKNIQAFTKVFVANQMLDYHIGTLTSTMDLSWKPSSCYAFGGELFGCTKYVERSTPNGAAILEKNLMPGTGGSGNEEFFAPVMSALSAPLVTIQNAGFYRQDAYLAVIFVTDSDDQSSESANDLYRFLLQLKGGASEKVISYGVYIPTADSNCERSDEPLPEKLEEFFALSKAKTLGLCDAGYGLKLAALGDDLARRVGSTLFLSRPAVPETITVAYGTQLIPNDEKAGWIYDPRRNALIFGSDINLKPEPPGTQVEVDFIAAEY